MAESNGRRAVAVGLFVIIGVGILGGGILTVGNIRDTFSRKMTVTTVFPEVSGLQAGDNVWFSGVKVGTVKDIELREGSKVEVTMRVDREASVFIPHDSLAKIGSDGLIGNPIVVIYGGTDTAPKLKEGDRLVPGKTVSTEEIMASVNTNSENLEKITADLGVIIGKIKNGEGTLGRLINEDAIYTKVDTTLDSVGAASDNAKVATAQLSTFSRNLNQPGTLPYDVVHDTEIYPEIKSTVSKAGDAVDTVSASLADPETPVGVVLSDKEVGADLKATVSNLNESSALLAEDLKAAQSNFLLRRYFKKKEKLEKKEAEKAEASN